jgi:ketosteroid isomerase-like protein
MSQENVEMTRRAFQAFNNRDLDALLARLDDNVEAFPLLATVEGGYHGHDGIRRYWANVLEAFPDSKAEVVEVRDFGDLTLAVLHLRGRGAESDTPFVTAAWHVSRFRHGKCIGWRVYTNESEALEAVGPRE